LESLQLNPEFPIGLFVLGFVALQQGRFDEAISAHRQAVAVSPGWKWGLGYTYALAGHLDEARQILLECSGGSAPKDAWDAWTAACVATGLGETEQALQALEVAYQYRHSWMPWIAVIPMFDVLHSDPRFADLVRRLQLPKDAIVWPRR
jgi:tetratricopeptide (TPR) repeat protein